MLQEGESVERLEGGLEIIQNERYYRLSLIHISEPTRP